MIVDSELESVWKGILFETVFAILS